MAQITLTLGVTVHTLPYPSSYSTTERRRVHVYQFFGGGRSVDKRIAGPGSTYQTQLQWEQITGAELDIITQAYMDLRAGQIWDYVGPDGEAASAILDPDLSTLNVVRFAGVGGEVLYTARLNIRLETF